MSDSENQQQRIDNIKRLAESAKAVILAHNYQPAIVQDIADHVGDSLGLAIEAQNTDADVIVFCGVHFMAESAKILNPDKTVLLPNIAAGCSLADSITAEVLQDLREEHPDRAVVTYINSTAEVKAMSDICCTSANAASVVRSLSEDKVLFTPDRNLGNWVKNQVPEKDVMVYDGACPTHDILRSPNVEKMACDHDRAIILAHPECRQDIIEMADAVCSTTGMLTKVAEYPDSREFIIATEVGIIHRLEKMYPDHNFMSADGCIGCRLHCPYMKMISLADIENALDTMSPQIEVDETVAAGARRSLERMLAVPRDD